MISGPQALHSLDEALRDIRREEDEIAKRLARSGERVTKFRETEAELFRQLARLRLDPAVQGALNDRISGAEQRARDMLKKHAQALAATEEQMAALDRQIAELTADRAGALAELDSKQAQLQALSGKITQAIENDPSYARKRQAAEETKNIAEEAMRKTEQAEADREQKGRPYRDDPLFMYLWDRGYGTSAYKAGNLVRYLDGKVADLIGYHKARPNYAMLNEIPLRLREHAERQSELAEASESELDRLETEAIDAAGGRPLREAIEAVRKRMEAIDEQLVALEDQRDDTAQSLRDLSQGKDPEFEQALSSLAEGLGREDIQNLLAEARRTPTGQDDTLVAQIDDVRAKVREEDVETRDQKERLKTLAARRRELEDIQYEFKKARFDDPRSTFRQDDLVGDALNDFLRGTITAASYWDLWRRSQKWSPGSSDWGGGIGLPRHGRSPWQPGGGADFQWPDSSFGGGTKGSTGGGFSWPKTGGGGWGRPSGGGFSRPRTGSMGSRKTGGFKTGGGF